MSISRRLTSRAMQPPWPRAGVVGCAASPMSVDSLQPHVSPGSTTLRTGYTWCLTLLILAESRVSSKGCQSKAL